MSDSRVHVINPQTTILEKSPTFYVKNEFQIFDPDTGIKWLQQITPRNVRNLRRLWISVHAVYNPGPYTDFLTDKPPNGPKWREFLDKISTEADGLQEIVLYLDSEPTVNHWGPAVDVEFVRALGRLSRINDLQKLEIRGYFPKEWPGYLEQTTGLKVWDETAQGEMYLRSLRDFQGGLKDQNI
ncbi:hypothetical protein N7466_001419 [Penicillium verhagenii]|uniref:uncharacterized protein n=1 Tax=Penicillium verhagenii TaxID=1562060 RepID=UPI0025452B10|nr:uncharacterized protein N7466_001419 [Penicillium verhagenii]KAJ5938285.1 hypothetical protein N7466_001419 [Penicillium verhagenii]